MSPRKQPQGPAITVIREDGTPGHHFKAPWPLIYAQQRRLGLGQCQVKIRWPEAEGPMMVHRLDMDTSGLMVITKTWQAYHHCNNSFCTTTSPRPTWPCWMEVKRKHGHH
ncbi:MAG: hypothetical protein IPK46_06240 [Saprospiraceae bacterium]|nr:hypothetical protein [Saprospiraceae bacterium]